MKKLSEHFTIDELTHSYAAVENGHSCKYP